MKKEFKPNAFKFLKERGFIKDCSHPQELEKALEKPVTFYLGIDPTADNLHIGHFFALRVFRILQEHGHRGILLHGNGTAMVGDPSFKNEMRKLMSKEELDRNAKEINDILHRFIILDGDNPAIIAHNGDWLRSVGFVEFMRNVGTHFNVAKMLSAECYKNRIKEGGLTFFEMGYMLMQSWDFVVLNDKYNCTLQIGGSDQWGNILAGSELGRKMSFANGKPRPLMFAMCNSLLVKADGTKMGKTESGVLWVSRTENGAYDCYQHFINVFDEDVERLLTFFTEMPIAEIKSLCQKDIIAAKKHMATAVTQMIHGTDAMLDTIPTETITVPKGTNIVDILASTSIVSSKREARELITAGAILIDNEKITDINFVPGKKEFLIKKGKKTFLKIIIN